MIYGLLALKRDLEALASAKGVTVPEVVQSIKSGAISEGADPEIVKDFFSDLDEVARMHTN
jgi:hypothetical protein